MNQSRSFIMRNVIILTAGILILSSSGFASKTNVSYITASDGVKIALKFYPGPQENSPAIMLLHMTGRNMNDWNTIIPELTKHFSVLAIDFRGHGQSKAQEGYALDYRDFTNNDWKNLTKDVNAAYAYLKRSIKSSNILAGIIGASIGANVAANFASEQPEIKALVLLSPGLDYYGIEIAHSLNQYKGKTLILASMEDAYSFQSSKSLARNSKSDIEFRSFKGAYHGNRILNNSHDAKSMVIEWLKANLK